MFVSKLVWGPITLLFGGNSRTPLLHGIRLYEVTWDNLSRKGSWVKYPWRLVALKGVLPDFRSLIPCQFRWRLYGEHMIVETIPRASFRRFKPCVKNVKVMLVQAHRAQRNKPVTQIWDFTTLNVVGGKHTHTHRIFQSLKGSCRFLSFGGRDCFWFRIRRL